MLATSFRRLSEPSVRPCTFIHLLFGVTLFLVGMGAVTSSPLQCAEPHNIRLSRPVQLAPELRAQLAELPPLKVLSFNTPPLAQYDAERQTYTGVGIDILCFIAEQTGLQLEIADRDPEEPVADKLKRVQAGQADILVGVSDSAERARSGLFTDEIMAGHYAAIARRGARVQVRNLDDLAHYRVGYVSGVSIEPILQKHLPASQLHPYPIWGDNKIFQALRQGDIDIAIYNQNVFNELRYTQELFDLEVIHTLYDYPRSYRYYLAPHPEYQPLVQAINVYLDHIDAHTSFLHHQDGEHRLLDRYISQRSQRAYLLAASITTALLALMAYISLRRHRRLTRLLQERNRYIEQQHQALYEANQKLEALSRTDPLTGLFNRRHFDESLAQAYEHYLRRSTPLSLLVIDVDRFKSINDIYGHSTGDMYLRTIAQTLKETLAHTPYVIARYGGEEFTCLLNDTTAEQAYAWAERLRQTVEQLQLPNATAEAPWVTASMGVATVCAGDPGVTTLFAKADAQLYQAKQSGRNQVCATTLNG